MPDHFNGCHMPCLAWLVSRKMLCLCFAAFKIARISLISCLMFHNANVDEYLMCHIDRSCMDPPGITPVSNCSVRIQTLSGKTNNKSHDIPCRGHDSYLRFT